MSVDAGCKYRPSRDSETIVLLNISIETHHKKERRPITLKKERREEQQDEQNEPLVFF